MLWKWDDCAAHAVSDLRSDRYQGESNSALARAPLYSALFSTMIEDWRHQWGVGDFPFLYVQISNFKSSPTKTGGIA